MKHIQRRNAVVLLAGVISVGAVQAQTVKAQDGANSEAPIPAITDWSSRSVIHRKPKMPDEFARTAAGDAEMSRLYRDPRYTAQLLRRIESEMPLPAMQRTALSTATTAAVTVKCDDRRRGQCKDTPSPSDSQGTGGMLRDWSNVLGGGTNGLGGRGMPGVFPAKYNFNITATPSCTNDFVVYPTNAVGSTSSGAEETYISSFTGDPGQGVTQTVTVGATAPRQVVLTSHATDNTGLNFRTAGVNNDTRAANLRDAINRWSQQTGLRAEAAGAQVTVYSNTVGNVPDNAMSENLNNFNGGSSWAGANGSGTAGQPTIIAFNQLYQGTGASNPSGPCNGAWNQNGATKAPNVLWAYNTGTGAVVETSPVLSFFDDGRQAAFIQRTGNALELVLLKWQSGQGTAGVPIAPTNLSAAAYAAARGGAATAMHRIALAGTDNLDSTATFSSPFVDYSDDILWVGDGNGRLHKFTGVFEGTPTEVIGGGFPAQVIAGASNGIKLSSPVEFNGQVYVGSQSGGTGVGGKLHRIDASNGAVVDSAKLANDNTTGIREAIIATYAPTASGGSLFAFLFNDGTAGDGQTCDIAADNNDACRVVARFTPGFLADTEPTQRAYVGRGNNAFSTLYQGAFDDAYFTSVNGTGNMYIVGGDIVDTFIPTLWKIPITNGVMGAPLIGTTMGPKTCTTTANCITNTDAIWDWSAVSSIKNGLDEYFYFSMRSSANKGGCVGACLFMFNLADLNGPGAGTGATWGTGNEPSASLLSPGGTGGITVDNTSSSTGSSQVYFSQLQSGGNAIQASQSGLQ